MAQLLSPSPNPSFSITAMVTNLQITSLGRLPNAQRLESNLSDRQRLSRAKFKKYRDIPVKEDILVNTDTKKYRQ